MVLRTRLVSVARRAARALLPVPVRALAYRLNIAQRVMALAPLETQDVVTAAAGRLDRDDLASRLGIYRESLGWPFRQVLVDAVTAFHPSSVLEVGCHVGPNLRLLAERDPAMVCRGVEVNPQIAAAAREWLWDLPNVVVETGDLRACLRAQATSSVDVVYSSYAMAYISPADLPETLRDCWRIARRAVVLMEPQTIGRQRPAQLLLEWRHDFRELLRLVAPDATVTLTPLLRSQRRRRLNALLVAARDVV